MDLLRKRRTAAEFESFVRHNANHLHRVVYLITSDLQEAEDLVQEALVRVARRWPRVRRMDHPEAYARRIVVNLALDGSTRRSHRVEELGASRGVPAELAEHEIAPSQTASVDTRDELLDALRALPPRQRTILVLRYFEDLSESQVAAILGCSTGTVKSTTSRGIGRLREALEASRNGTTLTHPISSEKGAVDA